MDLILLNIYLKTSKFSLEHLKSKLFEKIHNLEIFSRLKHFCHKNSGFSELSELNKNISNISIQNFYGTFYLLELSNRLLASSQVVNGLGSIILWDSDKNFTLIKYIKHNSNILLQLEGQSVVGKNLKCNSKSAPHQVQQFYYFNARSLNLNILYL